MAKWLIGGALLLLGSLWVGDVGGMTTGMREANLRLWRTRWSHSRGASFVVWASPLWAFRAYGAIVASIGIALLIYTATT